MTLRTHATISHNALSSTPVSVAVTHEEVSFKRLNWKNLELATRAIHRDGLVVLENVVDHSKLDALNKKMVEDALTLQSAGDASPFNYNKGYDLSAFAIERIQSTDGEKEHTAGPASHHEILELGDHYQCIGNSSNNFCTRSKA